LLNSIDTVDSITNALTTHKLFDYKEVFGFSNQLLFYQFFLFLFFICPGFSPAIFQRIAMAKSITQVKQSFIIAAVTCFILLLILDWIGVLTLAIDPTLKANDVIKHIIFTPTYITGFKGLILAGFMATIMSTVDSWINSASVLIVHDFLKPLNLEFNKSELFSARIVSLIIGVFSLFLSLQEGTLQEILIKTYSFYMPVVSVPFIMAVFGFRSSGKSVILGMAAGISTVLMWDYVLKIKVGNSVPAGMLVNLIVLMGSHYLFKQSGGWIGIKDKSGLIQVRRERRRRLRQLWSDIKSFNLIEVYKNNYPEGDGLISILGFYVMLSVFATTNLLPEEYRLQHLASFFELLNTFSHRNPLKTCRIHAR